MHELEIKKVLKKYIFIYFAALELSYGMRV